MYLDWRHAGEYAKAAMSGYGNVATNMKEALTKIGVTLDERAKTIVIHGLPWETEEWSPEQTAGIYTMWEFSKLPEGMQAGAERFDFALVPCHYSAEIFRPHFKWVGVVPHGTNPEVYYPRKTAPKRKSFTVLSAASNLRKGIPEVCRAFQIAGIPNSKLILKGADISRRYIPDDVDVEFIGTVLSKEEMRKLYWSADCYLSGSRGEGWDLIAWDALACGVPTIVPNHTAYKDWAHLAQGKVERFTSEPCKVVCFGDAGDWLIPDPEEMASELVRIYEDREAQTTAARHASGLIQKYYTWEDAARTMMAQLQDFDLGILGGPAQPETRLPLVDVEFTRDMGHTADVGGNIVGPHRAGDQITVMVEVARVLKNAEFVEYVPATDRRS